MVSEGELIEWWNRKLVNYIQNYARRNTLTISKAREKNFIESHEKFTEVVPHKIKKFLDQIHDKNRPSK